MIAIALTRADVQARLGAAQAEILSLGVRRLALFGSVQRNAARPDSDVDLLVRPRRRTGTFSRSANCWSSFSTGRWNS
jgi:predicted nucleotidyltransferase